MPTNSRSLEFKSDGTVVSLNSDGQREQIASGRDDLGIRSLQGGVQNLEPLGHDFLADTVTWDHCELDDLLVRNNLKCSLLIG